MKKLFIIPLLFFSLTTMAACSEQDDPTPDTEQPANPEEPGNEDGEEPETPDKPSGNSKILVAYFSATGTTQRVAERIVELTGADVYRIEAAEPYAENPYDDSDRIQNEAYNDLRPGVANLPETEVMAGYDTIFVGSPCWWHQPAMVVCTFLEAYDLTGKTIIPFFTYGATTYLNESMQKIYKVTPNSEHIPASLPEDLNPDDITTPGPADDAGIDMPGSANGTEAWLRRMGIIE
ncbi:flavodoxin [Bacteroides sp. HPS0048]|uniref:flavodoxin n=1 Tax=Bacteroides sp. HPS0048 TaxID=1078089 RepID=UPI0035620A25